MPYLDYGGRRRHRAEPFSKKNEKKMEKAIAMSK